MDIQYNFNISALFSEWLDILALQVWKSFDGWTLKQILGCLWWFRGIFISGNTDKRDEYQALPSGISYSNFAYISFPGRSCWIVWSFNKYKDIEIYMSLYVHSCTQDKFMLKLDAIVLKSWIFICQIEIKY